MNGSLRRDASSKFGENNRWGTFYGIGLAWALSDEAFFSNIASVSDLKIRASYGKLGNDNIPSFQGVSSVWRGQANNIVYSFGDGTTFWNGSTVNNIPNPDLKWEETQQFDIGFDLSMFSNKLTFVVDYFHRNNQTFLSRPACHTAQGQVLPGSRVRGGSMQPAC
ncbi:MAG: TonB-dependent receptor [Marinilabiliales bacterium]|nr:TonB-dependent receptor [Marinilabiliales bacterium]